MEAEQQSFSPGQFLLAVGVVIIGVIAAVAAVLAVAYIGGWLAALIADVAQRGFESY